MCPGVVWPQCYAHDAYTKVVTRSASRHIADACVCGCLFLYVYLFDKGSITLPDLRMNLGEMNGALTHCTSFKCSPNRKVWWMRHWARVLRNFIRLWNCWKILLKYVLRDARHQPKITLNRVRQRRWGYCYWWWRCSDFKTNTLYNTGEEHRSWHCPHSPLMLQTK